jgi:hypothetical protein
VNRPQLRRQPCYWPAGRLLAQVVLERPARWRDAQRSETTVGWLFAELSVPSPPPEGAVFHQPRVPPCWWSCHPDFEPPMEERSPQQQG